MPFARRNRLLPDAPCPAAATGSRKRTFPVTETGGTGKEKSTNRAGISGEDGGVVAVEIAGAIIATAAGGNEENEEEGKDGAAQETSSW